MAAVAWLALIPLAGVVAAEIAAMRQARSS
jgi:hypothetical protein